MGLGCLLLFAAASASSHKAAMGMFAALSSAPLNI